MGLCSFVHSFHIHFLLKYITMANSLTNMKIKKIKKFLVASLSSSVLRSLQSFSALQSFFPAVAAATRASPDKHGKTERQRETKRNKKEREAISLVFALRLSLCQYVSIHTYIYCRQNSYSIVKSSPGFKGCLLPVM